MQLPLPSHLNAERILAAIGEQVDVDLLNPVTSQKFYGNQTTFIPPTAGAILHILDSLPIDLSQEKFLVLGQGSLVGKPVTHLLNNRNYNISAADINTTDTVELMLGASVIISGVGKPKLITGDNVTDGVVIIDAGTSESAGKIAGDVDFDSVEKKARFITPVPGGVGPVTVAKLIENVVTVAETLNS